VRVIDPGIWNLEAGPDFLGATLQLEPHRRRWCGDVEIHIRPSGWKQHGHSEDPRYRGVRIHVTYFPGRVTPGLLPPGTVEIALEKALAAQPGFFFESVDTTAYPFAQRATEPPCARHLASWSQDEKGLLLDAAGQERLRRKTERLSNRIDQCGPEQAVYEDVMGALGYKHNQAPFRRLAQILPVEELRALAGADTIAAYAMLAGLAGLLPHRVQPRWDTATRRFLRQVWDQWWKHASTWASRCMAPTDWRLSGQRPANHPLRRLMGAASLFTRKQSPGHTWQTLADSESGNAVACWVESMTSLHNPYWDQRLTLGGKLQPQPIALLGLARARAIVINVVIPWLAATRGPGGFRDEWLRSAPADSHNSIVRQTAFFLFGPDHSTRLYRDGLRRQGLMQIFHDFCIHDRTRCAACPLPSMLRAHHGRANPHFPQPLREDAPKGLK
jgi:hypothetical protein